MMLKPMGPSMLILTKEPYIHSLATPLYVEVLAMISMLQQLIVLKAAG